MTLDVLLSFAQFEREAADSLKALAVREGATDRWARRHPPLAFLAPEIVEADRPNAERGKRGGEQREDGRSPLRFQEREAARRRAAARDFARVPPFEERVVKPEKRKKIAFDPLSSPPTRCGA